MQNIYPFSNGSNINTLYCPFLSFIRNGYNFEQNDSAQQQNRVNWWWVGRRVARYCCILISSVFSLWVTSSSTVALWWVLRLLSLAFLNRGPQCVVFHKPLDIVLLVFFLTNRKNSNLTLDVFVCYNTITGKKELKENKMELIRWYILAFSL